MVSLNFTSHISWCWSLSKKYKNLLLYFYVSELLIILNSLLFVVFSKRAIDYAIDRDLDQMYYALYWVIILLLLNIVFKLISTKCNEVSRMKMLMDLQNEVSHNQMYSSWEFIKKWNTGDLQYRIQRDCGEIVQMITQTFPNFTLTGIRLFASLGLLWVLDRRLAIVILVITPLFLLSKLFYKKYRELNKSLKSQEGVLSHVVNENLKFRILIKTLGIEPVRWKKLVDTQFNILNLKERILNFSLISQSILKITVTSGFLLTFTWGVVGLSSGQITFGTMTAFLQLVGRVQNPMLGLLSFFPGFVAFDVALERVREILENKSESLKDSRVINNIEKIKVSNLGFKYHDKVILENISFEVNKGQSIAILGASGRGKTTLIRILLSVLKPDSGEIKLFYDDIVSDLNSSLRKNFGYVPQGDKLFSGTIRDNLLLGDENISEEKIQRALYYSCSDFVNELPLGLDTIVGESTFGLSEGQAQRIAIARVLLRDASIWLFDEITSALDSNTSFELMNRLKEISKNKVFVFVTHDLKLAECCDQVYQIN